MATAPAITQVDRRQPAHRPHLLLELARDGAVERPVTAVVRAGAAR